MAGPVPGVKTVLIGLMKRGVTPEDGPLSSMRDQSERCPGHCHAGLARRTSHASRPEGSMNHRAGPRLTTLVLGLTLTLTATSLAAAQQPAAPVTPTPEVGTMAPDFAITGATRYGLLRDSVRLSDFRGQTVVLAFFFQARTKG